MTTNQIINCNVFSDEEIIDARNAALLRTRDLVAELAYMMHNPVSNSIKIIYCENQIQSGKDFINNMNEILNYRKNETTIK